MAGAVAQAQALLAKHCPVYFKDYRETVPLVNLEAYALHQQVVQDNTVTGAITYGANGTTFLQYFSFYLQDAGLKVLGCCSVGAHKYDIEQLVIELDARQEVSGVLYMPHGSAEHFWIRAPEDLQQILVNKRRPLVFMSRGKHAQHAVGGTISRYFGFANDHCSSPTRLPAVVKLASDTLLRLRSIDTGAFRGLASRIAQDFSLPPVLRLHEVASYMRFVLPKLRK